MSRPGISIIIPTYNAGHSLPALLDSIQEQTFADKEVIIIDNESIDGTHHYVREHGFQLVVRKAGRIAAREIGVELAAGKYVLLLDSDQILVPDALTRLFEFSEREDSDALVVEELAMGEGAWFELLRLEDLVQFRLGLGLPRWFRRSSVSDFRLTTLLGKDHIHGEDRVLKTWLLARQSRIREVAGPLIYHRDAELVEYFQKQFRYAASGTGGVRLKRFAFATMPTLASLLSFRKVLRVSGSLSSTLSYYLFLFLKSASVIGGILSTRLYRVRSSPERIQA